MADDDMGMQGAKASTAMALTWISQNISASASEELNASFTWYIHVIGCSTNEIQ